MLKRLMEQLGHTLSRKMALTTLVGNDFWEGVSLLKKYKCVCCHNYSLSEAPPGTFEVCPVCFWEDDNVQFNDHTYEGGANSISLTKARENYKNIGAISGDCLKHVRKPHSNEIATRLMGLI
jgi:hypothetical protein